MAPCFHGEFAMWISYCVHNHFLEISPLNYHPVFMVLHHLFAKH